MSEIDAEFDAVYKDTLDELARHTDERRDVYTVRHWPKIYCGDAYSELLEDGEVLCQGSKEVVMCELEHRIKMRELRRKQHLG